MRTIFIFLATTVYAYGQFKPNSIGVVYLTKESKESYFFTLTLQSTTLAKPYKPEDASSSIDSIAHTGNILFFDSKGQLAVMYKKLNFKIEPWCTTTDSTMQHKVSVDMVIKKTDFKRKIEGLPEIQNISCFVLLNNTHAKTPHPDYSVSQDIKLKGDFDNDGQMDCFIWTATGLPCEGEPKNNLAIKLQIAKDQYNFRCCEN